MTSKSIKLCNHYIFQTNYGESRGWFRIFGKGLSWKDNTIYYPLFSERYGYRKSLKIKNWTIMFLNN